VTQEWAQQHPNTLIALTSAIIKAQQELRILEDFAPVWELLVEFEVIQFNCSPNIHVEKYFTIQNIIRNFVQNSAMPKVTDFEWLFQQMQKWNNSPISSIQYTNEAQSCLLLETYLAASKQNKI
jgi:NitT/TauT family transport system ATP-binding protein